jgi:hypothetical protein
VKRLRAEKRRQAFYYNKDAKTLKPLKAGHVVYVKPKKNTKEWIKAKVDEKMGIRSYAVVTHQGRTLLRRNRRHVRKANIQDVKKTRFEENSEMDIDPMEPLSTEDTEEVIRESTGPQPISQSQKAESSTLGSHTNVRQREPRGLVE